MPNRFLRLHPKPGPSEIARFRRAVLKAWHSHLSQIGKKETKEIATIEFCELASSGVFLPEVFERPINVCRATLYNWTRRYKDQGLDGLKPRWAYKWKEKSFDNLVLMLPSYRKIIIPGNPTLRFKPHIILPEIRRQWKWPPLRGPMMLTMFFSVEPPRGIPMELRMKLLRHEFCLGESHLEKHVTFVKNCLRGIVYQEDGQIISIHAEIHCGWSGKTSIYIRRLKG
jgi:hypothetical protein